MTVTEIKKCHKTVGGSYIPIKVSAVLRRKKLMNSTNIRFHKELFPILLFFFVLLNFHLKEKLYSVVTLLFPPTSLYWVRHCEFRLLLTSNYGAIVGIVAFPLPMSCLLPLHLHNTCFPFLLLTRPTIFIVRIPMLCYFFIAVLIFATRKSICDFYANLSWCFL